MGAKIANPRKQFQFQITIPGLNPFLCQIVKAPDTEFDTVEHGDTGWLVKTAGLKKFGKLTIEKICPADDVDTYFFDLQNQILNTDQGGGLLPSDYKMPILVEEYSSDGVTVLERNTYRGCWPDKVNGKDFSRKGSENTIQMIEFNVDQAD